MKRNVQQKIRFHSSVPLALFALCQPPTLAVAPVEQHSGQSKRSPEVRFASD